MAILPTRQLQSVRDYHVNVEYPEGPWKQSDVGRTAEKTWFLFSLKKEKNIFFCCSRRNARRPWRRRPVPVASWSMLPIIWSGVVTILTFVHFQPDYPHVLAKRRSRRDTFFPPFFRIMAAAAAGLFKTCLSPESGSSFVCLYSPSHLVVRSFWYNPVPHTL